MISTELDTTDKTSLVAAINEVLGKVPTYTLVNTTSEISYYNLAGGSWKQTVTVPANAAVLSVSVYMSRAMDAKIQGFFRVTRTTLDVYYTEEPSIKPLLLIVYIPA